MRIVQNNSIKRKIETDTKIIYACKQLFDQSLSTPSMIHWEYNCGMISNIMNTIHLGLLCIENIVLGHLRTDGISIKVKEKKYQWKFPLFHYN